MQLTSTELLMLLALLIFLAAATLILIHKRKPHHSDQLRIPRGQALETPDQNIPTEPEVGMEPRVEILKPDVPTKILIGENPAQPVVTIEEMASEEEYDRAEPIDTHHGSISRLTTLFQAAPSLLVASQTHGKRVMEVVINGDLVRAADGNGLRAFAMGGDGIKQHARLFEMPHLQSMINGAAIWQVASVIVAQKHLADITKKLDEIKKGINGISLFLDNQRKARIESTYDYLWQAYKAIQSSELPDSVRNQLEDCERDLLEIQHHLEREYRQKVDSRIKHEEMFGTANLTANITCKFTELRSLAEDIELCLKTRITGWYVMSLYPGEAQLKLARRESIYKSIESFQSLGRYCNVRMREEISGLDAIFNREKTLQKRRNALTGERLSTVRSLQRMAQKSNDAIERSTQLLLQNDHPTRILLQYDKDSLVGARVG